MAIDAVAVELQCNNQHMQGAIFDKSIFKVFLIFLCAEELMAGLTQTNYFEQSFKAIFFTGHLTVDFTKLLKFYIEIAH